MCKLISKFFLVGCASLAVFGARAQLTRIDSLKNSIAIQQTPAKKLQAMLTFCDEWDSYNADTLKRYALEARQLAVNEKNDTAVLVSDYYLAAYLLEKNKVDTALSLINNTLSKAKKIMPYSYAYAKLWLLRGNVLQRTLHYDEVLKQNLDLLPIAEQHKDTFTLIRLYTGIGNVNLRLKKYPEALAWHYKAVALMTTDELKAQFSMVYINIGVVHYHIATINDTKQNEDSIELTLQKAIKYARQGNSLTNLANALSFYGNTLAEYNKLKPAEAALTEAIETRRKIGDAFYQVTDMIALSAFYENSKNYEKAIAINIEALKIAVDYSSKISVYASLGEVYSAAGKYKEYSGVLEKRMSLLDTLYKTNTAEAITEMEAKYNVQKKENTIIQQQYALTKEHYFIYAAFGILLLLCIAAFAIFKIRRQQQLIKIKQIMLENERATIQAVENAKEEERMRIIADLHDDVGGGLSTIRMVSDLIAEQKEQSLQLEQYASKISGITKDVTQRMNTIVWALNTENDSLQNLSEYIREYGYSFFENSSITFKSNLPDNAANVQLSGLQRKNLFLCVKEALNNAYKHSGAKNVQVSISFAEHMLTIDIKDDGNGIENENAFGNGLKNMRKRMNEINGTLTIETGNGTGILLNVLVQG